jgi:hypothetical protein
MKQEEKPGAMSYIALGIFIGILIWGAIQWIP